MTKFWTAERWRRSCGRLSASLMVPMLAIGTLLWITSIYGAWHVYRIQQRGNDMLAENLASLRAAEELETLVRAIEYRSQRFISTGGDHHLERIRQELPRGEIALRKVEQAAHSNREQHVVRWLRVGYESLADDYQQLLDGTTSEAQRAERVRVLVDDLIPNEILRFTQNYVRLNEEELERSREKNQISSNRLMLGLLLMGTFGATAGWLVGYRIARRVNRTMVQLSVPIRDAAGKLNDVEPVTLSTNPGIEDLESILKLVSERVSTVVERLHQNEREMLRSEQLAAVGQLAAGMAHELRNPLTAMKTILQLAEDPSELAPRDLQVLKEEMRRVERSVQNFLDFARPPQPAKRQLELGELLQHTSDLVARRAERQEIQLDYRPPIEPLSVVADATQIHQLLLNLLLNALDAVASHGIVRLEVERQENPLARPRESNAVDGRDSQPAGGGNVADAWAVIRVSDSGTGLPGEIGERIFQPFVSTKETGLGLGLSICRRIVEAHGGEIGAIASAGGEAPALGGAVFEVRLPIAATSAPSPPSGGKGSGEQSAGPPAPSPAWQAAAAVPVTRSRSEVGCPDC